MTDADWQARVVQASLRHDDLLPQRVRTLRKDGHDAAVDLRAVPEGGAEIVLTVASYDVLAVSRQRAGRTFNGDCDTWATFEGKK
jgi:hypothetical protein